MSVWIADRVCDYGLYALVDSDAIYLCSARPRDYTEATSTYALGVKQGTPGDFFSEPTFDAAGRKVVAASFSGGAINVAGTATRWAAVNTINGRLLATGTIANAISVKAGQSFSMQSWEVILRNGLSIPFIVNLAPASVQVGPMRASQAIFREWRNIIPASIALQPPIFTDPEISTTIAVYLKTGAPIFTKPDLLLSRNIVFATLQTQPPRFTAPSINNVVSADSDFVTADSTGYRADYFSVPFRADSETVTADNTGYSVDYSS